MDKSFPRRLHFHHILFSFSHYSSVAEDLKLKAEALKALKLPISPTVALETTNDLQADTTCLMGEDRSEIVFFDVETTVPTQPGQGFAILEFGAILVCPKKLTELTNYSTLVCPTDLSRISSLSERRSGICKDAIVSAPTFASIADAVYDLLNGRIWAGHNILRFDRARVREAFAEINRPAPEPKGTIDSLLLLTKTFRNRAGDMKMASLAKYFGLGLQEHRSLSDARMNLEVLKYCATVLFLESSLPDIFTENSWVSPHVTTRSSSKGKLLLDQIAQNASPSSSLKFEYHSASPVEKIHQIQSLKSSPDDGEVDFPQIESNPTRTDSFDLLPLSHEIKSQNPSMDIIGEAKTCSTSQETSTRLSSESLNSSTDFLEPNVILVSSNVTTRSCTKGKLLLDQTAQNASTPSSSVKLEYPSASPVEKIHQIQSLKSSDAGEVDFPQIESNPTRMNSLDLSALSQAIESENISMDIIGEEKTGSTSQETSTRLSSQGFSGSTEFLEPNDILVSSISVALVPSYSGAQKLQLLHNNFPLQISCRKMKIRFGIDSKFVDHAGRARYNFVVDAPPILCKVLEASDDHARMFSIEYDRCSEWRPTLTRKAGYYNYPTVRLHLPTFLEGDATRWATEIYQEDTFVTHRQVDVIKLESLLAPGNLVDAYFSLDAYNYRQSGGIRLVTMRLIVHSS